MSDAIHPSRGSWLTTLGWACYLACSWTWCIGMFLPVLLIRDYGMGGFVVFAVPNVIGAAAMGWVLRRPGASRGVVAANAGACRVFSIATIAFHAYTVFWLGAFAGLAGAPLATVATLLAIPLCAAAATRRPGWSCAVWLASGACALVLWRQGLLAAPRVEAAESGAASLGPLAGVCLFGFAFCPYLDLTFHRARESCGEPAGTRAFAIGFVVFFGAMIGLTVLYTHLLIRPTAGWGAAMAGGALAWLGAHFVLQSCFTVCAHFAIVRPPDSRLPMLSGRGLVGFAVVLTAVVAPPLIVWLFSAYVPSYAGLSLGEVGYRLFMAFYGLVFPAYVWLCMIPTRDGHSGIDGAIGRRKLVVWAAAVAVAAPAYWMGFIERDEWWLVPGLAVVLWARLFVPGGIGSIR